MLLRCQELTLDSTPVRSPNTDMFSYPHPDVDHDRVLAPMQLPPNVASYYSTGWGWKWEPDVPLVGFIGRLTEQKGVRPHPKRGAGAAVTATAPAAARPR